MKLLYSLLHVLEMALKFILQALMLIVTLVVTWQVFSRYVLNDPSSLTEELARFILIWLTLLGCAYAYRKNNHLGLDLVYAQAVGLTKKVMYYFMHIAVLSFALMVMVFGGFELMSMTDTLGQTSPALGINISLVYSVIPISGALIIVFSIQNLLSPNIAEE